MSNRPIVAIAVAVLVAACQAGGPPSPEAPVASRALGSRVEVGANRRLTLPPTQYERVHFLAKPGQRVEVALEGPGAVPLSLSIYPMLLKPDGSYTAASREYPLKPFQRTSPLPLQSEVVLPTEWQPRNAVVVEVKNISSTTVEPTIKLELK